MKSRFISWRTVLTSVFFAAVAVLPNCAQAQSKSFTVDIASPTNGAFYPSPASISLIAGVTVANDNIASVQFFDGSNLIGTSTAWAVVDPPGSPGLTPGGRAYFCTWSNQTQGIHTLTATATDTNGNSLTSSPVTVTVGSSNLPTVVQITEPTNGSVIAGPTNVQFTVSVNNPGQDVADLTFTAAPYGPGPLPDFVILLGTVSNWTSLNPATRIYTFVWSNAFQGQWAITAAAVRTNDTTAGSDTVHITILGTNNQPVVRITSPPNNSEFRAPVNVALVAYADELTGSVASVEFFAGTSALGFGQPMRIPVAQPLIPQGATNYPISYITNTFEFIWSNAPPGSYAITAVAVDTNKQSAMSQPINITILPEVIPPTNKLAIVSIFATDPIAVAGTNCWRWLGGPPTWSNWVSPVAIWQWYTNCGPKDASFTVVRNGNTNSDLTVDYAISGTASNGVDYAALPGNITIPAGQTEATITLVPVEAVTNVMLKSAVLTLKATTNVPTSYIVGIPRSAEVIIVDTDGPQKLGSFLPDGSFHLSLTGPDGAWFHIDFTTDLINWTPLCTNQVVNGAIDFIDPNAAASTEREYRAVPMTSGPSN